MNKALIVCLVFCALGALLVTETEGEPLFVCCASYNWTSTFRRRKRRLEDSLNDNFTDLVMALVRVRWMTILRTLLWHSYVLKTHLGTESIRTQVNSYSFWSTRTHFYGQFVLISFSFSQYALIWSIRTHFGQLVVILIFNILYEDYPKIERQVIYLRNKRMISTKLADMVELPSPNLLKVFLLIMLLH